MATEPLDEPDMEPAQTAGDALTDRCVRAEQEVEKLQAELAAANARITELEAAAEGPISIFDSAGDAAPARGLARDGSDPRVLSMVLAATAVVAGMVALLAFLNSNLDTTFGFAVILATVVLAYAAAKTRVDPVKVSITRGVVYIDKGETSYRFDIRNAGTHVDMVGEPGDPSWQLRFHRKGMDDFVLDDGMVDAHEFVRQLREHRPEL